MNLKKFWVLYFSTALVGLLLGLLTTLSGYFGIGVPVGLITGGFLSATSMMGFWAYLTLNFTMRNFVSFRIWVVIQALLVALVFYDLVYFRYMFMTDGKGNWLPYLGYAIWPLIVALLFAYLRSRLSGLRSFIPALFYVFVFTVIEWFVALKSGQTVQMTQVGIILLGCNCYLLMMYHRLLTKPA